MERRSRKATLFSDWNLWPVKAGEGHGWTTPITVQDSISFSAEWQTKMHTEIDGNKLQAKNALVWYLSNNQNLTLKKYFLFHVIHWM